MLISRNLRLPFLPQFAFSNALAILPKPKFCQSILEGAQAVVVLAAVLGGAAEANYGLARRTNVDATLSLFESLRNASRPPRIVFASSIAVFGDTVAGCCRRCNAGATDNDLWRAKADDGGGAWITLPGADGWTESRCVCPASWHERARMPASSRRSSITFFTPSGTGKTLNCRCRRTSTTWLMSAAKIAENRRARAPRAARCAGRDLHVESAVRSPHDRRTSPRAASCATRIAVAAIRYRPDPAIEAQFGRYPPLDGGARRRLGFTADDSIDALIRDALP